MSHTDTIVAIAGEAGPASQRILDYVKSKCGVVFPQPVLPLTLVGSGLMGFGSTGASLLRVNRRRVMVWETARMAATSASSTAPGTCGPAVAQSPATTTMDTTRSGATRRAACYCSSNKVPQPVTATPATLQPVPVPPA